jgi:hypothetical protein
MVAVSVFVSTVLASLHATNDTVVKAPATNSEKRFFFIKVIFLVKYARYTEY